MEGPNLVSGRPPSWGAASSEGPRVSFGLPRGTPSSGAPWGVCAATVTIPWTAL